MPKCYLCQKELTKNNSTKEHIIPNALGGRLAAKILCKACNSKFGHSCDVNLANSLKWFSYLANHPRSHGKVQPVEVLLDGQKVRALPGFKFAPKQEVFKIDERSYYIRIFGSMSEQEIEQRALSIFLAIHKKSGKALTEEQVETFKKFVTENHNDIINHPTIEISIQFQNHWTALLKIAINFAISRGIDVVTLSKVIDALKINTEKNSVQYVNFYYSVGIFPDQSDSIFHTLLLRGSPKEKALYCLISLYGVLNVFVLLSDDYEGEDVHESYCYDIWNGRENQYSFISDLTKEDIRRVLNCSEDDEHNIEKMTEAVGGFFEFFKIEKYVNAQEMKHAFLAFVEELMTKTILNQTDVMTKQELMNRIEKEVLQHKKSIFGVNLKDKQVKEFILKMEPLISYDIYSKNKSISLLFSSLLSFVETDYFLFNQDYILNTKESFFTVFLGYLQNLISKNHPLYTQILELMNKKGLQEEIFREVLTRSKEY